MDVLLWIVGVGAVVIVCVTVAEKLRRNQLLAKYGDPKIVDDIMARKIWQGMTEDQLIDSWGKPVEMGEKVYKNKKTETFKYDKTGRNRFSSRVTLENGRVVGWQQR